MACSPTRLREFWQLSRPRGALLIAAMPVIGYGFALWEHALPTTGLHLLALTVVAWWLVHAASLWLNAALDRDGGPVLFGSPIAPPSCARPYAYVALLLAVAIGTTVHPMTGACVAVAACLAVLYSHPATVWKGHPIAGPAVNALGYGVLSPAAGWVLVNNPVQPRTVIVALALVLGALSVYFMAQTFQQREDTERRYRTLVVTHGPHFTASAARMSIRGACAIALLLAVVGWFPRICLLAAPVHLWIDSWMSRAATMPATERHARVLVTRMLIFGGLLIVLAATDHAIALAGDGPVAGLATAHGAGQR